MTRSGGADGNVKRIEKGKEDFIFVGWTILDIKYSDFVPISSNNRSTQGIRVNKSSAKQTDSSNSDC